MKPSAAPEVNHSSIVSATCSGVPAKTRCPRAPASRCSSRRTVGRSRSTIPATTCSRLRALSVTSPASANSSTGTGPSRSRWPSEAPVIRSSWRSPYAGTVSSLNSCSSARAPVSVPAMNGLIPGRILRCSGRRPSAAARCLMSA
ncbi:hypothetical protein BJF78_24220 [Pseudonocardia sp. CNS-139]|nr:hypothetical protein BJF78_24220 [Pseudonocardia sp. CNS-139]